MMIHVSPMAPIPSMMKSPDSITSPTPVTTRARVVEKHELRKPAIAMRARLNAELDFRLDFDPAACSRDSVALTFRDDSYSTSTAETAAAVARLTFWCSEIADGTGARGAACGCSTNRMDSPALPHASCS